MWVNEVLEKKNSETKEEKGRMCVTSGIDCFLASSFGRTKHV